MWGARELKDFFRVKEASIESHWLTGSITKINTDEAINNADLFLNGLNNGNPVTVDSLKASGGINSQIAEYADVNGDKTLDKFELGCFYAEWVKFSHNSEGRMDQEHVEEFMEMYMDGRYLPIDEPDQEDIIENRRNFIKAVLEKDPDHFTPKPAAVSQQTTQSATQVPAPVAPATQAAGQATVPVPVPIASPLVTTATQPSSVTDEAQSTLEQAKAQEQTARTAAQAAQVQALQAKMALNQLLMNASVKPQLTPADEEAIQKATAHANMMQSRANQLYVVANAAKDTLQDVQRIVDAQRRTSPPVVPSAPANSLVQSRPLVLSGNPALSTPSNPSASVACATSLLTGQSFASSNPSAVANPSVSSPQAVQSPGANHAAPTTPLYSRNYGINDLSPETRDLLTGSDLLLRKYGFC